MTLITFLNGMKNDKMSGLRPFTKKRNTCATKISGLRPSKKQIHAPLK